MKSIFIKITLVIASVFAVLLCIEIVLSITHISSSDDAETWRVRGIFQPDKELIYSLKPGKERSWEKGQFSEHVKINQFGLRDDELQEKTSYEKRIIVLGDSMTFGHGVNNDETFPNQLERIFQEKGRHIDVINAGIKGYGTDQSYKLFITRLRTLKPDMVIFAICINDVFDNINLPLYTIEEEKLVPLDPTKNWLYLSGKINNFLPEILQKRNLTRFIFARLANRDWFSVLPDLKDKELLIWSIKKIYLQIEQLQKMGEIDGFKLMILCVPYKDNISEAYSWLEKDGLWLLNAHKDDVWMEKEETLFFPNDYHLTKTGNALLAEKLYDSIKQSGF